MSSRTGMVPARRAPSGRRQPVLAPVFGTLMLVSLLFGAAFALLVEGRIQAQIARRLPLERAAKGLCVAESGTIAGKAVLIPGLV